MRTSEPQDRAPWTLAASVPQAGIDYGAWSRHQWQPARVPAVRYAADEDCLAGCGHTEPAVLARRRRHRLLRRAGPDREAQRRRVQRYQDPAGWTAVPGKVVLMTEVVLPVTIRDLTRQDLPSCAWGVSAWDLARLGRALERAERGEVDYLAVCPPSGLPVALGGVDCTLGPGAGHLVAAGRPRGPGWYGPGAGKSGGAGLAHCPRCQPGAGLFALPRAGPRPPYSFLCIRRDPRGGAAAWAMRVNW